MDNDERGAVKIYIASKTKHGGKWLDLIKTLPVSAAIISTWINEYEEGASSSYVELADRCINEAKQADMLIVYAEEGEQLKGALIEVGAALANQVPVFIVGAISRVFDQHPLCYKVQDINSAIYMHRFIKVKQNYASY